MQQPLACKEALANMHGRFSAESAEAPELLLGLPKYAFGTIVGMTRLCCPALPSWQQWMKLDRACFYGVCVIGVVGVVGTITVIC